MTKVQSNLLIILHLLRFHLLRLTASFSKASPERIASKRKMENVIATLESSSVLQLAVLVEEVIGNSCLVLARRNFGSRCNLGQYVAILLELEVSSQMRLMNDLIPL